MDLTENEHITAAGISVLLSRCTQIVALALCEAWALGSNSLERAFSSECGVPATLPSYASSHIKLACCICALCMCVFISLYVVSRHTHTHKLTNTNTQTKDEFFCMRKLPKDAKTRAGTSFLGHDFSNFTFLFLPSSHVRCNFLEYRLRALNLFGLDARDIALCAVAPKCPQLADLDLTHNPFITDQVYHIGPLSHVHPYSHARSHTHHAQMRTCPKFTHAHEAYASWSRFVTTCPSYRINSLFVFSFLIHYFAYFFYFYF